MATRKEIEELKETLKGYNNSVSSGYLWPTELQDDFIAAVAKGTLIEFRYTIFGLNILNLYPDRVVFLRHSSTPILPEIERYNQWCLDNGWYTDGSKPLGDPPKRPYWIPKKRGS